LFDDPHQSFRQFALPVGMSPAPGMVNSAQNFVCQEVKKVIAVKAVSNLTRTIRVIEPVLQARLKVEVNFVVAVSQQKGTNT
jgi:hypothetical protein